MPKRLALVGNQAFSMLNFRAPLMRELVSSGIQVFALAPNYTEEQREAVRNLGAEPVDYRMTRNGINPLEDTATFLSLLSILRRIKPTIILSYAIKPVIYGTLAASLVGVPHRFAMIEGLGHVFVNKPTLKSRTLKSAACQLYRLALSRAERTFFLNKEDKSDFIDLNLVDPARATVIGAIGVDLTKWQAAPPVQNPVSFLFVGRLLKEKGIIEFIEAARQVKKHHPQARYIVLGDIDTNPSSVSRNQVSEWVKEGLIIWPGHVPVAPWIEKSSVFVLPSFREGMPRSTQEAMAMGRAVITTDVPGCRDTVENGWNGFMVPPNDASALAKSMEEFILDPTLISTMGERSRSLAEDNFDEKQKNATLMSLMGL